jgi:predicted DNA-binding antitoxin AbrB/MazE fold protein
LESTTGACADVAVVQAEYQDGVLRPVKPLRLRQGERVQIIVKRQPDPSRWDLERLARTTRAEVEDLAAAGLGDWVRSLKDEDGR